MSEQTKIFRGDRAPEEGAVDLAAPALNVPAAPVKPPSPAAADGGLSAAVSPAPADPAPPAAAAHAAPAPLDFQLDDSQLFHTPEAVRQRMAQLASIAHSTAHLLDEQAEQSERIAKRLKSL